jgi:hypothetical protein
MDDTIQLHKAQDLLEMSPEEASEVFGPDCKYPFSSISVKRLSTMTEVNNFVKLTWKLFAPPLNRPALWDLVGDTSPDPLLASLE